MTLGVIVGSAFGHAQLGGQELPGQTFHTPFGEVVVHRYTHQGQSHLVIFRHGTPHTWLPNQIPYRGHAWALKQLGCEALLVTSSVGVLDPNVPLDQPLLVGDLLMPENRLPDGSTCTIFDQPYEEQGHLVLEEGLFNRNLGEQIKQLARTLDWPVQQEVTFAYCGGPRTKTAAENRYWAQLGAQVNSMTLGPEIVLANELEIPCAGLVVGHKYSVPTIHDPLDHSSIEDSLKRGKEAFEELVCLFLQHVQPPPFANRIHRFEEQTKTGQTS